MFPIEVAEERPSNFICENVIVIVFALSLPTSPMSDEAAYCDLAANPEYADDWLAPVIETFTLFPILFIFFAYFMFL